MPVARAEYCSSSPGLLKWFGIIIASIVLILLLIDKRVEELHSAEQYVVATASITIGLCLILLIVFFFDMHRTALRGARCHNLAGWIFILLAAMWLAAGAVETWYTVVNSNRATSRWIGMRASAAALSFLNAFLFATAMQQTRVVTIYTDI